MASAGKFSAVILGAFGIVAVDGSRWSEREASGSKCHRKAYNPVTRIFA